MTKFKGRNISGRSWKILPQKRASDLITKQPQNNKAKSWKRKQVEIAALKSIRERQEEIKQTRISAVVLRKERRLENEKRRMENEFKNSSKNSKTLGKNSDIKIKRMNKKQLRQIKKTRMNKKQLRQIKKT